MRLWLFGARVCLAAEFAPKLPEVGPESANRMLFVSQYPEQADRVSIVRIRSKAWNWLHRTTSAHG